MKQFQLNVKKDFIIYLHELITRTDKCISKKKKYLTRLSNYISEKKDQFPNFTPNEIKILYQEYSEFVDLLSGTTSYILNLIGDHQSNSISYFKFRDLIFKRKKKGTLGFEIRDIDEQTSFLLVDLNKIRNWFNHVPESLLLSEIKLINEGKFAKQQINPIEVVYYKYCTLELIIDFYNSESEFYNITRKIHQSMKKDYSSLIGENISIERIIIDNRPIGLERLEPTKISSDVQGIKGKLLADSSK